MKTVLGLIVVVLFALGIGIWTGILAYGSVSVEARFQMWLAALVGGNLLLGSWAWYRARPGSGDAMVLPSTALLSASMLIGILPRLLWPAAERIRMAASIVSLIVTTVLVVFQIRRLRRLRRTARPAARDFSRQ